MVDRIEYDCGISCIGDRSDIGEFRVKESLKKKCRPEVTDISRIESPPSFRVSSQEVSQLIELR